MNGPAARWTMILRFNYPEIERLNVHSVRAVRVVDTDEERGGGTSLAYERVGKRVGKPVAEQLGMGRSSVARLHC